MATLTPECSGPVSISVTPSTIMLVGTAPVHCYIYILSNVSFVNRADEPGSTTRTIEFQLFDERSFEFTATTLVTIIPTNDPVIFSFDTRSITFNESTREPVNLFEPGDTLVDSDGNSLHWVSVIIRPTIDEMDVLFADPGTSGLLVDNSTDADGNIVLTISGYANFSTYENVLQTLTFQNTYPGLNLDNRTVEIVTFDGETESPPTLIVISIDSFDDLPVCYFRNDMVSAVLTS